MSLARGPLLFLTALLLGTPAIATTEPQGHRILAVPGFPVVAEVLSDADGPLGYRTRAVDGSWQLPPDDAVLLDEAWWTPLRPLRPVRSGSIESLNMDKVRARVAPAATPTRTDRLTTLSTGDVNLDGRTDLVLSFRRPFGRNYINITRPRRDWVDSEGLSAHIGLYRPGDLSEIWVAGTLVRPVVAVAACDGALAVAYGEYDEPGTVATDAWRWIEFGFLPAGQLPGPGTPTCVDIDGDGRTEPAILERSTR